MQNQCLPAAWEYTSDLIRIWLHSQYTLQLFTLGVTTRLLEVKCAGSTVLLTAI